MRRTDDTPLDPEIVAQLDAIDATLAGDPVDPRYAELAELALLVTAEKPAVGEEFAASMDRTVARRFDRAGELTGAGSGSGALWHALWRGSLWGPLAGLAAGAAVIAVVAVVVANPGGGGSLAESSSAPMPATSTSASASSAASAGAASSAATSTSASAPAPKQIPRANAPSRHALAQSTSSAASGAVRSPGTLAPANGAQGAPAPQPSARKIVQSAQLALAAQRAHIDAVAQELFNVIGRENGYVNNSSVTAGAGGYAQFELSVPSSALQATMTALSQLQYASVVSRTDATQDVNGQYLNDVHTLADARALRTSLLKQLANATTEEQIDSLKAQLNGAEAAIRSDEATLGGLNHRIDYSQISVTINAAAAVPVVKKHHSSGAFTLGKATHDAGRVLTVAAGIVLIALAALLPLALIAALGWWIAAAVRRRRREQALDMA
jgi:hypothetical protein